jgi:hypothetical protein
MTSERDEVATPTADRTMELFQIGISTVRFAREISHDNGNDHHPPQQFARRDPVHAAILVGSLLFVHIPPSVGINLATPHARPPDHGSGSPTSYIARLGFDDPQVCSL